MSERHYLLKVLGLSGIPKVVTFGLTIISFPLLIRSLGATEYGVVLMIGAALGIFEVLVDFGVSSAAGKAMASIRAHHPQAIRREFFAWARLQAFFVVFGFGPMLLAAMLMLQGNAAIQLKPELLYVMTATVVSQVALNFIRANLLSLLAFKSNAVLDTLESVLRSTGYLVVAFFYSTAIGMVLAGLITSVATASLAIVLVGLRLSGSDTSGVASIPNSHASLASVSIKARLRDSFNFLWLRLSTRLFQQGPLLLIGRMLGPELVGIIGAFSKISEIISTPYLVIGNALMVKVNEISRKGRDSLQALWDAAFRIMSTALLFAAVVYLASEPLANLLVPSSPQAPKIFCILSLIVFASAVGGIIAPMSDYAGGLFQRNLILSTFAILQLIVLWAVATVGTQIDTIITIVTIYLAMIISYTFIASKSLFGHYAYNVRIEIITFYCIICSALFIIGLIDISQIIALTDNNSVNILIFKIGLFFMIILIESLLAKKVRRYYFSKLFFDFNTGK